MAKTVENDNVSINLLGAGTKIVGEIISNGDFRIDGTLQGNIKIKGKLVLGQTGRIDGNIICQNADFSGNVFGNIKVYELLTLQKTSRIDGDINIGKLSIEPGAVFSGKCSMGETNKFIVHPKGEEIESDKQVIVNESSSPEPNKEQKPEPEQKKPVERQAKFMFNNKNEKRK